MRRPHNLPQIACAVLFLFAVQPSNGAERSHRCTWSPLSFDRNASLVKAGDFAVTLKGPDAESAPQLWEGPIEIRDLRHNKTCTLAVRGLIERPLLAINDRLLILVTSSGSNFTLATIDLLHCAVAAVSRKLTGPIAFRDGKVFANGQRIRDLACDITGSQMRPPEPHETRFSLLKFARLRRRDD